VFFWKAVLKRSTLQVFNLTWCSTLQVSLYYDRDEKLNGTLLNDCQSRFQSRWLPKPTKSIFGYNVVCAEFLMYLIALGWPGQLSFSRKRSLFRTIYVEPNENRVGAAGLSFTECYVICMYVCSTYICTQCVLFNSRIFSGWFQWLPVEMLHRYSVLLYISYFWTLIGCLTIQGEHTEDVGPPTCDCRAGNAYIHTYPQYENENEVCTYAYA
jgi:hypothetical protein